MSGLFCSEVHSFNYEVDDKETGNKIAKFVFSMPKDLGDVWTIFEPSEQGYSKVRRSRSIPADVCEDSGDEDFEVPRFTSLDYNDLMEVNVIDYDSDGDLNIPRKGEMLEKHLLIEHKLMTELCDVGMQVWKGSLLLGDYMLENHCQVIKFCFHSLFNLHSLL